MDSDMDAIFKALADETRRAMLDRLLANPGLTLNELVVGTEMRRQSASKHVKILEDAGLIMVERQGREKKHYINVLPIQEISRRWVDKFSRARADAILNLKEALEQDAPDTDGRADTVQKGNEQTSPVRGPAVTSFFTPVKD